MVQIYEFFTASGTFPSTYTFKLFTSKGLVRIVLSDQIRKLYVRFDPDPVVYVVRNHASKIFDYITDAEGSLKVIIEGFEDQSGNYYDINHEFDVAMPYFDVEKEVINGYLILVKEKPVYDFDDMMEIEIRNWIEAKING